MTVFITIMTVFLICIILYLLGVCVAEILYRFGDYDSDHYVVFWSWVGAFVILVSLGSK